MINFPRLLSDWWWFVAIKLPAIICQRSCWIVWSFSIWPQTVIPSSWVETTAGRSGILIRDAGFLNRSTLALENHRSKLLVGGNWNIKITIKSIWIPIKSPLTIVNYSWLVVWNMFFIFHFIYGMSSFPIDELHHFSRWKLCTTNQTGLWFQMFQTLWIFYPGPDDDPNWLIFFGWVETTNQFNGESYELWVNYWI